MGYKSDKQIENELKKQAKKEEKAKFKAAKAAEKLAKKEENSNLPAKESSGIGKFFKRMRLKLGLGITAIAGLVGLGTALQNEKSSYEENLDNNARVERESKDDAERETHEKGGFAGSIKNIDINSETIIVEVEAPTSDIRQELEKQTINYDVTPERESVDANKVIEKAKEEVGLSKDEDTPDKSVIATTENKGKEADEMAVEKIEPDPEKETESHTKAQNDTNTSEPQIEEETTKTVIDLDSEENISNKEEKEGFDLVIEHDKDDQVFVEDGTIILEGDGDVVIGFEEETTEKTVTTDEPTTEENRKEHDNGIIENVNPFDDDWSR